MNKNKVIVFTTITVILATAAVSAFAASSRNKTVTCPNCGTSVELPVPEREGKSGPKSLDELKTELDEAVANGEMTQEEADARLAECEERRTEMEAKQAERKAQLDETVASGELTQEEADRILERGGKGGPGKAMNGNRGGGRQAVPNADVADNAGQEQ